MIVAYLTVKFPRKCRHVVCLSAAPSTKKMMAHFKAVLSKNTTDALMRFYKKYGKRSSVSKALDVVSRCSMIA